MKGDSVAREEAAQQEAARKRVEKWNPVVIVYRRSMFWTDSVLQFAGAGEFTHCELFLPYEGGTFAIFAGGVMQCSAVLPVSYTAQPHYFAWQLILMDEAQYTRLKMWNIKQVEQHCPYNFTDLAWQLVPFSNSVVSDISSKQALKPAKTFCSQAIVLALKDAFSTALCNARLKSYAGCMNSRLVTPTELAHTTTKWLGMSTNNNVVPMNRYEADKHMNELLLSQHAVGVYINQPYKI